MAQILGIHTPADGRNLLLNPESWLFQRTDPSTPSVRTNTQYGPDRWKMLMENTGVNISRSTTAPANAKFALLLAKSTTTGRMGMIQILESSASVALRNKTVTFQIQAQSPSSNVAAIRVALISWAGTADTVTADPISVWSASPTLAANFTQLAFSELTLTSGYQRATVSAQVPGACNNLLVFVWTPNQEASGDSVLISAASLNLGITPIAYSRRDDEIEFAECQRFYEKSYNVDTVPGTVTSVGRWIALVRAASANLNSTVGYRVTKRVTPTVVIYSDVSGTSGNVDNGGNVAAIANGGSGASSFETQASSGLTTGSFASWQYTSDAEL